MKYILFCAAALIGLLVGDVAAGLLTGAALWAAARLFETERGRGRDEADALRREVDDLRRRVARLEGLQVAPQADAAPPQTLDAPAAVPAGNPPEPAAARADAPQSVPQSALARLRAARENTALPQDERQSETFAAPAQQDFQTASAREYPQGAAGQGGDALPQTRGADAAAQQGLQQDFQTASASARETAALPDGADFAAAAEAAVPQGFQTASEPQARGADAGLQHGFQTASAPRRPSTPQARGDGISENPSSPSSPPPAPWYAENALAAWFVRGNPLLKTGVVVLFLGLAFLLRYASERVQIPVGLRYLTVAGAGLAAALAGWKLQGRRREYGLVLEGFGMAVMYLTALAALKLHPLLPAPVVFAAMAALVAAAAAMAVKQDAQPMAQAALVGGLAAPLLVSDGSGQYVVLFSYLALLNAGVAAVAWFKAWRPLNLTGFAGTFLIGAAWGLRDYAPPLFASVEPFLLYHWLLYTLVALFFARRRLLDADADDAPPLADNATLDEIFTRIAAHGMRVPLPDHTLLFGTAFAAFGLQWAMVKHWPHGAGWSALGFAAAYALFALPLRGEGGLRPLRQAFAALALVWATLAVPLFFNGADTASLWTLEAALVYWFGLRQRLPHLRLSALAVYLLAALAQLAAFRVGAGVSGGLIQGSPTAALLAAAGGGLLYFSWAQYRREGSAAWERGFQTASAAAALFYASLLPLLLFASAKPLMTAYALLALAWAACRYRQGQAVFAVFALLCALVLPPAYLADPFCCFAFLPLGARHALPLFDAAHYLLLSAALSAAAWLLARPQRGGAGQAAGAVVLAIALALADAAWRGVLWPSENAARWLHPVLLLAPFVFAARYLRWRGAQYLLLAAALFYAALLLPENFRAAPFAAWGILAAHTALAAWLLSDEQEDAGGFPAAVHAAALLLFGLLWQKLVFQTASLWLGGVWLQLTWLAVPAAYLLLSAKARPALFERHPAAYRVFGGTACALAAAAWLLWANFSAPRAPAPLPYLPVFNPLELAAAALLWFGFAALPRLGRNENARQAGFYALCAAAFLTISAGVMRLWHFYGGTQWRFDAMMRSVGLQAGLSVVWALAAIVLMVSGNRSGRRARWMAGAVLMGVVVVKLFLVELGSSSGIERIASFIIVGLLLLLVGWFAPVPPREGEGGGDE
ncbi:DUF2339 domain-containing protein [Neisseria bacilliformis]|uniref:DUF2339 domain-containing protein n=1 Tax=Neisseria bacilliformis TaxID=267212 RepID=UPI0028E745DA|nr:DUF2339 domain-containing protein [Neisseria bacilliformis]